MQTRLYFVRHGESEANERGLLAAHMDVALTERGREQARACAEALCSVPFSAIYSSDLTRTMQTAEPHGQIHGLAVVPTAELREFDAGLWTGMSFDAIAREYPELYPGPWRDSFGMFQPPEGESMVAAAQRLYDFSLACCRAHGGGHILLVTHAGILRAFWGKLMGIAPEELAARLPFCPNASYSCAELRDGCLVPLFYGRSIDEGDAVTGEQNA